MSAPVTYGKHVIPGAKHLIQQYDALSADCDKAKAMEEIVLAFINNKTTPQGSSSKAELAKSTASTMLTHLKKYVSENLQRADVAAYCGCPELRGSLMEKRDA